MISPKPCRCSNSGRAHKTGSTPDSSKADKEEDEAHAEPISFLGLRLLPSSPFDPFWVRHEPHPPGSISRSLRWTLTTWIGRFSGHQTIMRILPGSLLSSLLMLAVNAATDAAQRQQFFDTDPVWE